MITVGVTLGVAPPNGGLPVLDQDLAYSVALENAGAAPLFVPPLAGILPLRHLYEQMDCLCLPGGRDVQPAAYGEEPIPQTSLADAAVELSEIRLLQWALADDKPVLAICRGMQLLNVVLGGTLWQDISTQMEAPLQHKVGLTELAHPVAIMGDSRFAAVVGSTSIEVNTSHHQALKALGRELVAVGTAPDGIIEVVEIPTRRFVIGVQFHPEVLARDHQWAQRLYRAFLDG